MERLQLRAGLEDGDDVGTGELVALAHVEGPEVGYAGQEALHDLSHHPRHRRQLKRLTDTRHRSRHDTSECKACDTVVYPGLGEVVHG